MESSGRSPEERRAAAEARARARAGEPPATGDEELLGGTGPRGAAGQLSRHYGGGDVYMRRRLIAAGVGDRGPALPALPARSAAASRSLASASSAISLASASDEVAAGEGALRTCSARSVRWTTKSSTSLPSRSSAWARIPDGPGQDVADRELRDDSAAARGRRRGGSRRGADLAQARSARSARRAARCPARRGSEPRSRGRTPTEPVGVAGADHQRRGPEQHLAVDRPGQVAAEEGQLRVGDRVDAGPDQLAPLGPQPQVAAAEGHDARLGRRAGRDREPVRPGARAGDRRSRRSVVPRACSDRDRPPSGVERAPRSR